MSEDKTYNGWSNYETWAVNLWLENDQGTYYAVLELVNDTNSDTTYRRSECAAAIQEFVSEMMPDLGGSLASDLLNAALSEVDWYEIADSWQEIASEQD